MYISKSESLLCFPTDYVILDLETTGHSPDWDDILEIAVLRYKDNNLVSQYTSLLNIGHNVPTVVSQITGITTSMICDAPILSDIMSEIDEIIGDCIIIGHNVSYDINFLNNAYVKYLGKTIKNSFVDTLRLARLLHKDRPHNRLIDLCEIYDLDSSGLHRSIKDCLITKEIYDILKSEYYEIYGTYDHLKDNLCPKKQRPSRQIDVASIKSSTEYFDESHPLYGRTVVFTGALERMNRETAMQRVVDKGGFVANSVTRKTNLLVLGNYDYCSSIKGGKSSKHKKAESLLLDGYDISIIPEDIFYIMIQA